MFKNFSEIKLQKKSKKRKKEKKKKTYGLLFKIFFLLINNILKK